MLFEVEDITCDKCGDKIEQAIRAADPTAQITVKADEKRVRVEGVLTPEQAMAALAAAGYPASEAPPHSGEGSECCGGCS